MTTDKAIILDTETHALNGNAVEIAYYPLDLSSGFLRVHRKQAYNERFNPLAPIALDAMGVHNILDEDLIDCRPHTDFMLAKDIKYIIGHNIDYDVRVLRRCGVSQILKPIDTLALARALLLNVPNHKLATLSYYLAADRQKVREYLRHAHSALTDVDLTASLLKSLLPMIPAEHTQDWEALYCYSLECRIPKVMPFGEHKGLEIINLPGSYQTWLLRNAKIDPWIKVAIRLFEANIIRRTYEIRCQLSPGTYHDHQFLDSSEPVEIDKSAAYEALLFNFLDMN